MVKHRKDFPLVPIPGNIQGQDIWSSEQPDLLENVPAYCRCLDWLTFKGAFQPNPFYDSKSSFEPL